MPSFAIFDLALWFLRSIGFTCATTDWWNIFKGLDQFFCNKVHRRINIWFTNKILFQGYKIDFLMYVNNLISYILRVCKIRFLKGFQIWQFNKLILKSILRGRTKNIIISLEPSTQKHMFLIVTQNYKTKQIYMWRYYWTLWDLIRQ